MGEFIKIILHKPFNQYKNAFMNLALPLFALSEPGEAQKTKISDSLFTTVSSFQKTFLLAPDLG